MNLGTLGGLQLNGSGAAGTATLAEDLIAAIVAYFQANATLTAAIPGGLWNRQARTRTLPFAVINQVSITTTLMTAGGSYDFAQVQFSVFGSSAEQARTAGKVLCGPQDATGTLDTMDQRHFEFADGVMSGGLQRLGRPGLMWDGSLTFGNVPGWHYFANFRTLVNLSG